MSELFPFKYPMISDTEYFGGMLNASNIELAKKGEEKQYRYPIHANENMAIGLLKRTLIKILLEDDESKRAKRMHLLKNKMEQYTLPYRIRPGKERKFKPSNKNKRNLKRTF